MDNGKKALVDRAWQKARYGKQSYDYNLVYEAIGYIKGLVDGGVLEFSDVRDIDTFLIRDGLNNSEWCREVDKRNRI